VFDLGMVWTNRGHGHIDIHNYYIDIYIYYILTYITEFM
jgi:hypothetical protein